MKGFIQVTSGDTEKSCLISVSTIKSVEPTHHKGTYILRGKDSRYHPFWAKESYETVLKLMEKAIT